MGITNADLAEYLQKIATAYEIKGKTKFQIAAYQNASDIIQSYPKNIYNQWKSDPLSLDDIPNIGPSIAKKLNYYLKTRKDYPKLKSVFKNIHPAVFTFTKINGIGPLIAHRLTQHLKFPLDSNKALEKLITYAKQNKISLLPNLGIRSQQSILDNTLSFLGRKSRMKLDKAQTLANKIINFLRLKYPQTKFIALGSLRRQNDTVGDIDIAASSTHPQPLLDYFTSYPDSIQTIAKGKNKASIRLLHDIHVDLMIKTPNSFGSLTQHFTGSRQHNIILRKYANKLGYSISEYGIKQIKSGKIYHFSSEKKLYNFLNLKFIPPPKRTGNDELETYKMV